MLLMRLLSVGRSFIGMKYMHSRYKLLQSSLPKFGKPGRLELPDCGSTSATSLDVRTPSLHLDKPEAAPAAATARALAPVLTTNGHVGTSVINVLQIAKPKAHPESDPHVQRKNIFEALGSKAADAKDRRLVQGELALEEVEVVRNDLSDSDVEFVAPGRRVPVPTSERIQQNPGVNPAKESRWTELTHRLFAASRSRI